MEKWYGRLVAATALLSGGLWAASWFLSEFRVLYDKFVPGPAAVHPVFLFVMGILFGAALACLVAPASFLRSKAGRVYFEVMGASTTSGFRLKCLSMCALFGLVAYTFIWMAYVVR
jgi:hypothetical protein